MGGIFLKAGYKPTLSAFCTSTEKKVCYRWTCQSPQRSTRYPLPSFIMVFLREINLDNSIIIAWRLFQTNLPVAFLVPCNTQEKCDTGETFFVVYDKGNFATHINFFSSIFCWFPYTKRFNVHSEFQGIEK